MRRRNLIERMLLLFIVILVFSRSADALGPWRAQVVDVEEKRPLEDVVVIAVWSTYLRSGESPGSFAYADADEVVTDKEGRFTIAARNYSATNAFILEEPEFFLFKAGYGQWRFRGEELWLKLDPPERRKHYEQAGRQFETIGVVIEMPRLKTREERLRFYQNRNQLRNVPADKTRRLREAEKAERAHLGL